MKKVLILSILLSLITAVPAISQSSTNYKLNNYEFGSGGGTSSSTNYGIEGIAGEAAGSAQSTNYKANSGLTYIQNANVPPAPTFVNSSSWYNKLKFTINTSNTEDQSNGTVFAIAISHDNWSTTQYIQSDNTVGSALGMEDYQSYTAWGGSSGAYVIGLIPNTTYKIKLKAFKGVYTESAYGPEASAATVNPSLSFDIDIGGPGDPGETSAPYSVSFGSISAGTIDTPTNKIWVDFGTNGELGGYVYIYDQYAGLKSSALNYTIATLTGNLSSQSEGYGLQGSTTGQTSGGPLTIVSPYDGASQNIGQVDTTIRSIFASTGPIVGGRGSINLKVKSSTVTPASTDYADTLTMIASGSF